MNKEKILAGIRTCAHLESIWHNNRMPSSDFDTHVKNIREILESLLETKCKCVEKKKKCCDG